MKLTDHDPWLEQHDFTGDGIRGNCLRFAGSLDGQPVLLEYGGLGTWSAYSGPQDGSGHGSSPDAAIQDLRRHQAQRNT